MDPINSIISTLTVDELLQLHEKVRLLLMGHVTVHMVAVNMISGTFILSEKAIKFVRMFRPTTWYTNMRRDDPVLIFAILFLGTAVNTSHSVLSVRCMEVGPHQSLQFTRNDAEVVDNLPGHNSNNTIPPRPSNLFRETLRFAMENQIALAEGWDVIRDQLKDPGPYSTTDDDIAFVESRDAHQGTYFTYLPRDVLTIIIGMM